MRGSIFPDGRSDIVDACNGMYVSAVEVFADGTWIARLADGRWWTLVERDEYFGTHEEVASVVRAWARAEFGEVE